MLNAAKPPVWRAWLLLAVACWAGVAPAAVAALVPGFELRGPETRVGNFFPQSAETRQENELQVADSHQGNEGHGYETASGVHDYLYAHADPVGRIDPSGKQSLLVTTIVSGVQSLLQKMSVPHTRTAIVFVGSYGLGFTLGIKGPDATVAALSAAGVPVAFALDVLGRGAVVQRGAIRQIIGVSYATAFAVARSYIRYLQPATFMGSIGLVGFATGYATGMTTYVRLHPEEFKDEE